MATHAEMAAFTHSELMTHTSPTGGHPFNVAVFPGARHMLEIGPGTDPGDAWQDWTLVDITSSAGLAGESVRYTKGRRDEQSQSQPGELSNTLLNDDGVYTPRNWTSPYFPDLRAGIPVRYGINLNDGNGYTECWSGDLSSLTPGWDQSANLPSIALKAMGTLSRLQEGTQPLRSAMTRGVASQLYGDVNTPPVRYWPMEEGAGATQAAEYFGGLPIVPAGTGAVSWGGDSTTAGSAPLPTWAAGAEFVMPIPVGSATGSWRLQFMVNVPTGETADATLFAWKTSGTLPNWRASWTHSTGKFSITGFDSAGVAQAVTSGTAITKGTPYFVVVDAAQSGTDLAWEYQISDATSASITNAEAGLETPGTVGNVSQVSMLVGAGVDGLTFGQLSVFDVSDTAIIDSLSVNFSNVDYQYANGWLFETPIHRFLRLCSEEGIRVDNRTELEIADDARMEMGAQPIATLIDLLRECESADGGFISDGYGFGLRLFHFTSRENRAVDFALNVSPDHHIAGTLSPAEDNQGLCNDATVSSATSSGRFTQPDGEPYAPAGPGGIGPHDGGSTTMNLFDDAILRQRAGWIVHQGTVDEDRYPDLSVDFVANASIAAFASDWLASDQINERVSVTGLPSEAASSDIDVFSEGLAVLAGQFDWTVGLNARPASPWSVFVMGESRVDTAGSSLTVTATAGATSITVTSVRRIWTTAGGEYPMDLSVGGVKVTASACSGAGPQTFTISALPVAVAAGRPVKLWRPDVIALGGFATEV
jgi:hypothetical protein